MTTDQVKVAVGHCISRAGAHLGNWNDRRHGDLGRPTADASRRWRVLNRIAGRLYTNGWDRG